MFQMPTFNLDQEYTFGKNINKNIRTIIANIGDSFAIKSGDINVQVKFEKIEQNNGMKYFALYSKNGTRNHPIKILFINIISGKHDNSAYINNLSKTPGLSGTDMMNIILKFLDILMVKQVMLYDGAHIEGDGYSISLSFIKLLETGKTWYMKFGFKLDTSHVFSVFRKYSNPMGKISELLAKFKKITVDDMIEKYENLVEIMKLPNVQVLAINPNTMLETDYHNVPDFKFDPESYKKRIDILIPFRGRYLYECMLDLCKKDPIKYEHIESELLDNNPIYSYSAGDKTITREYCLGLTEMMIIKNNQYHIKILR